MATPTLSQLASKTSLLLTTAISVHLSLSPPNPPVAFQECAGKKTLYEKFIQSITFITKSMVWVGTMCDVIATLSLADPSISTPNLVQRAFCPSIHSSRAIMWTIQPTMIAGTIMVATAAALRLWCFRTLGQLFTFEVTIRPKHELITDGPYAYVRHPSYTGVFLTLLGATAVLCSPGTWLMECGILSRGGVVMLGFWIIKCAIAFKGTILRLRTEDEALRKTFGSRWDDYARRVPYSLIPGMI